MKVLLIDNYDSFTYNLYQYLGEVLEDISPQFQLDVVRNDEKKYIDLAIETYDAIVISPGPGNPADEKYFGVCGQILKDAAKKIPTLGVCLGMQGIAHVYGGEVIRAKLPMHGKTSLIEHDNLGVFKDLPQRIEVMRYHSLVVNPDNIPAELEVTSRVISTKTGVAEIMGLRHKKYPIEGIQFHPESFATEGGKQMLKNFLENAARSKSQSQSTS